jgi:hypothetical protein
MAGYIWKWLSKRIVLTARSTTSRTKAGLSYGRWLTTPIDLPRIRHEWLAQIFFAHQLSDEEIVASFEERAEKLRRKLELFRTKVQAVVERRFAEMGSERSRRLWQFTLDYGVSHIEWELQWVESALEYLRHLPPELVSDREQD